MPWTPLGSPNALRASHHLRWSWSAWKQRKPTMASKPRLHETRRFDVLENQTGEALEMVDLRWFGHQNVFFFQNTWIYKSSNSRGFHQHLDLFNRLRRVPPATMEKGYPANQQPLHWPSKNMAFVKTTHTHTYIPSNLAGEDDWAWWLTKLTHHQSSINHNS